MELSQGQIEAILAATAKIEAKEAEEIRLAVINAKNAELDAQVQVLADSYKEQLAELEDSPAARKLVIEELTIAAEAMKQEFLEENAEVYADPI